MPGIFNVHVPDTTIGAGAIGKIGDIAKRFKPHKILILTDAGIVKAGLIDGVTASLEKAGLEFDIIDDCRVEAPLSVIEKLATRVCAGGFDLLIGLGGGSVMDTTKVVSLIAGDENVDISDLIRGQGVEKTLPKILVPTTSGSGAEWSHLANVTDDGGDGDTRLILTPQNLPDAVVVDPELTLNLPPGITAETGMDALTHAIEAYIGRRANIVSDIHAEAAIRLVAQHLRTAYSKGSESLEERSHLSIAASTAMLASVITGAGLAHFMNISLGKKARISHGATVALMLPHVMDFNLSARPERFARIAELMGDETKGLPLAQAAAQAVKAVRGLSQDLNMPQRLTDVGVHEEDISWLVEKLFLMNPAIKAMNPREVSREDAVNIYRAAL
ncbi:iron-containing alcohol dehydrogenase [Thermodesulfobacteriota bacterium]